MKSFRKKFFSTAALFMMTALLTAGEAEECRLGDNALLADDYPAALSHYRSARKLAEQENLSEAWARNTLRLGKVMLLTGDVEGSRRLLKEYRERNPLRSAGTLPGDLLAADGKFAEAVNFYQGLENGINPALASEARFHRGILLLKQGDLAGAETLFRLESGVDSRWRNPSLRELAYILIRRQKSTEALAVLEQIPAEFRSSSWQILKNLAELPLNGSDGFVKNWRKFTAGLALRPDLRCCELLIAAAADQEKKGRFAVAADLTGEAEKFAATPLQQQNLFKQKINLQNRFDTELAAASAIAYGERFPQAADRFEVVVAAATVLAGAEKFAAAAELLWKLNLNSDVPRDIRCTAAVKGAVFAEKCGDIVLAARFHKSAAANSPDRTSSLLRRRNYAEFLIRNRDYRGAVVELQAVLELMGNAGGDELKFQLMDAAVRDGDTATVSQMAADLSQSRNPLYRCRAHYELGTAALERQDLTAARKEFLLAAAVENGGDCRNAAQYCAALMAYKCKDFKNAGQEALAFALNCPDSPRAAEALYIGYRSARELNDDNLKKECIAKLSGKYAASEAYAVYALQNAADRAAANRDLTGAIADLEELEQKFAANAGIVSEAMVMRAGILKNSGRSKEAQECALEILEKHPASRAAYQAALLAGNIDYTRGRFMPAMQFYARAAAMRESGVEYELAAAKAVECQFQLGRNNPKILNEALTRCRNLIGQTTLPPIRMELRYRQGVALEFAGRNKEAFNCYEQVINEALLCRSRKIPCDLSWAVRSAANALQIASGSRRRVVFNRSMKMIGNCRKLKLDEAGLELDVLQRQLEEKFFFNPGNPGRR